jgi:hypothetical protein
VSEVETVKMPADERREVLNRELQKYGAMGWRTESRSEYQATIARGKQISHVLHLLLTIITFGTWLLVWALIGILGGVKRG